MNYFDTAQICLNGHVITEFASSQSQSRKDFCSNCGERTIMNCQNCSKVIKGYHHVDGVIGIFDYDMPKFCEHCGKPFPWTIKQTEAVKELIDFSDKLNDAEKSDMKDSIDNLITDNPKTPVAQAKYKKYAAKAGIEIAKGIKDILVDVVSESVKKAIWG